MKLDAETRATIVAGAVPGGRAAVKQLALAHIQDAELEARAPEAGREERTEERTMTPAEYEAEIARLSAEVALAWADCHDGTCNACAKCCDSLRARAKVQEEALRRIAENSDDATAVRWAHAALSPAIDTGARAEPLAWKDGPTFYWPAASVHLDGWALEAWAQPSGSRLSLTFRLPDGTSLDQVKAEAERIYRAATAAPNSPAGAATTNGDGVVQAAKAPFASGMPTAPSPTNSQTPARAGQPEKEVVPTAERHDRDDGSCSSASATPGVVEQSAAAPDVLAAALVVGRGDRHCTCMSPMAKGCATCEALDALEAAVKRFDAAPATGGGAEARETAFEVAARACEGRQRGHTPGSAAWLEAGKCASIIRSEYIQRRAISVACSDALAAPTPASPAPRDERQIKHMVQRFLGWRLPDNFQPDAGISFKRTFNEHTAHPMKHEPTGTNLFDATQAEAMIRYMLDGCPAPAPRGDAPSKVGSLAVGEALAVLADEECENGIEAIGETCAWAETHDTDAKPDYRFQHWCGPCIASALLADGFSSDPAPSPSSSTTAAGSTTDLLGRCPECNAPYGDPLEALNAELGRAPADWTPVGRCWKPSNGDHAKPTPGTPAKTETP